jgi:hypothetical protein
VGILPARWKTGLPLQYRGRLSLHSRCPDQLSPCKHTILVDFNYDGGGLGKGDTATLTVDGRQVAQGRIERTIPFRISADETLNIGVNSPRY